MIRKLIFTSTKLLSAQEKNEFYRELLETEMEEGNSEERGDEEEEDDEEGEEKLDNSNSDCVVDKKKKFNRTS